MTARYKASPMSNADIRELAKELRKILGIGEHAKINIVKVLEHALPTLFCINYDVRAREDMEIDKHAYCDPETGEIVVREDVYKDAISGKGRDRFTIAHEIPHALFHRQRFLTRAFPGDRVKTFEDPEWQADAFAGEFLCPAEATRGLEIYEIIDKFGVSEPCAMTQKKKGGTM